MDVLAIRASQVESFLVTDQALVALSIGKASIGYFSRFGHTLRRLTSIKEIKGELWVFTDSQILLLVCQDEYA